MAHPRSTTSLGTFVRCDPAINEVLVDDPAQYRLVWEYTSSKSQDTVQISVDPPLPYISSLVTSPEPSNLHHYDKHLEFRVDSRNFGVNVQQLGIQL